MTEQINENVANFQQVDWTTNQVLDVRFTHINPIGAELLMQSRVMITAFLDSVTPYSAMSFWAGDFFVQVVYRFDAQDYLIRYTMDQNRIASESFEGMALAEVEAEISMLFDISIPRDQQIH